MKALKEGRTPTPGEPSEANETGGAATSEPAPVQGNLATFASVRIEDIPAAPVTQPFVMPTPPFTADNVKPQPTLSELMPKPGPTYVTTPATPSPSVLSAARPATVIASVPGGRMTVNDPRAKDAIELCNFAIASLKVKGLNEYIIILVFIISFYLSFLTHFLVYVLFLSHRKMKLN